MPMNAVLMSLAIIVMMNAPSKKAPAPHGSTPSGRLGTYDDPAPRGKSRVTGPLNRMDAY